MHSFHSSFLLLALTSIIFPAALASRLLFHSPSEPSFQVTLTHVDSGGNFTKMELIQRAIHRGRTRAQNLHFMALSASDPSVESPVHAGNGEFLMDIALGTPPVASRAILDTGSDLIWTQCKPCSKHCFDQPSAMFDPKKSSTFTKLPCFSKLCSALSVSACNDAMCQYLYSYGDYSSTQGYMATETFTFGDDKARGIAFGCGEDNRGSGFDQGSGLVGMGRGPLSLVSQLDAKTFAYCLTSIDSTKSSMLFIGSAGPTGNYSKAAMVTTPLITSPSSPSFYYLSLEGITVGDKRLDITKSSLALKEDGTGGMIIDSGTTITYIQGEVFDEMKKAFTEQVDFPAVDEESNDTGLEVCYKVPAGTEKVEVPKLTLHFMGKGAALELQAKNYILLAGEEGLMCLAMGSSDGMSIFGNFQQQNMMVVHDLAKETVSFIPTQCDHL